MDDKITSKRNDKIIDHGNMNTSTN